MATITEDYVSFETAKLLKEKGFNIETIKYWDNEGGTTTISSICELSEPYSNSYLGTHEYSCPSLYMTMKWLREIHKIFIEISVSIDLNGNYHYSYSILNKECKYVRKGYTDFDWNYNNSCEAAIKYCLEHLI